ncbi:hypothetical protein TNCV_2941811 [Trichonephila clavipes]|nr:hypothetical protein TNCV_2941811 [Trichonephila clavipes]
MQYDFNLLSPTDVHKRLGQPMYNFGPDVYIRLSERNRSMCWMTPSNCDSDLTSLDAEGNKGPTETIAPPCTAVRDDGWIVQMIMMDSAATSRTIGQ